MNFTACSADAISRWLLTMKPVRPSSTISGSAPEGYAITVSGFNALITGVANTSYFPTTEHAFQRDTPQGGGHPFVSELTPNGNSFVFSTYVASADKEKCKPE